MFSLHARDGSLFYLLESNEYKVGRKDCELLIKNDQSISRIHGKLLVKEKRLIVVDAGSRYGTFVNTERLAANTEIEVPDGCEIRFGQLNSYYIVKRITIITTTSTIKGDLRKNLTSNLSFLGGILVSNWNGQCTHVTVEEILLTVKVLCAVVKGTPIVTLRYWDDYVANVKQNLPPPKVSDYKPICTETTLSKDLSLDYKPERLQLFKHKIFVFPTKKDQSKMIEMIHLAGGDAISWDINPITTKDLNNSEKEYVVLEMGSLHTENIEPSLSSLIQHNLELGKRTVPIQELALALINCSCEKDCNPNFDRKGIVLAAKTQKFLTQQQSNVLVFNTQTQYPTEMGQCVSETIIPESIHINATKSCELPVETNCINMTETEQCITVKRENEIQDDSICNVSKKIKLDQSSTNSVNVKISESITEPPAKGKFTFRNTTITNEHSKQENSNPFTMKRKTRDADEAVNPPKRSITTKTDTESLPSTSKQINPFSLITKKKEKPSISTTTTTSRSTSPSEQKQNIIPSIPNSLHMNISEIEPINSGTEKSFCWLSKSKKNESTNVSKCTTPIGNGVTDKVQEEFLKYIESFRDVLVIKEEPMVVRRTLSVSSNSFGSFLNNGKNFKKFKKVQPLKIQTSIIPDSSYIQVTCNKAGSTEVVHHESSDDEVVLNIPAQKRFVF